MMINNVTANKTPLNVGIVYLCLVTPLKISWTFTSKNQRSSTGMCPFLPGTEVEAKFHFLDISPSYLYLDIQGGF